MNDHSNAIWWLGGLMLAVLFVCWWFGRRAERKQEAKAAEERRIAEARRRSEDREAWRVTGSNRVSRSYPSTPPTPRPASRVSLTGGSNPRRATDARESTLGDYPNTTDLLVAQSLMHHTPAMQAGEPVHTPTAPVDKRGGDWPNDDSASRYFGLPGLTTPSPAPEPTDESCRRSDYAAPSPAPEPEPDRSSWSAPTYSTPSYAPAPDYSSPSPSPSYDPPASSPSWDSGGSSGFSSSGGFD